MTDESQKDDKSLPDKLLSALLGLPWADVVVKAWKTIQKMMHRQSSQGMYQVLEYESTLELKDRGGQKATFRKREQVLYLQDSIIAYQDQAWGDGEILLSYRCTPGRAVDRYRLGHRTHVLISRREVKNKGDIDEFNIEWGIRQGFLRRTEQWETHVKHPTKHLKVSVVFPKSRPPQSVVLIESSRQRSHNLSEHVKRLPGNRWQVCWETRKPRLHETYILQWEW